MSVEQYVSAGREVEVPRPECLSCSASMVFWSGYWRAVRVEGEFLQMWVRRARCKGCRVSHALLPAFVLVGRLDVVESIGAVIERVVSGRSGVRPAAEAVGVDRYETARGWVRRFVRGAGRVAVAFSALAVELGGETVTPSDDERRWALAALGASWEAASRLPGWLALGFWRFVAAVSGGRLIAANTDFLLLVVGRRRFMPPIP